MKKLLLTLLGVLIALPTMARDFTYTYAGQTINYTVVDEAAKTCMTKQGDWSTAGNNVYGNLILPSNPKDGDTEYTLVEIGTRAFYLCTDLTSVTIPDSVISIGWSAFSGCSGLTSVSIGNSVTEIGGYAFRHCSNLTSLTIPNSVTSIGYEAFRHCSGLTSVNIPKSVTEIGGYAFGNCSSLTSIYISEYVSSLGDGAFCACTSLKTINVAAANRIYTSIDGIVYTKDKSMLVQYPAGKAITGFTVPNSVNTIGPSAFEDCSSLLTIIIPDSVTAIGLYTFAGCSNLTSVTIGNSVNSISGSAFERCSGLTSVTYLAEDPLECSQYTFTTDTYQNANLNFLESAEEKIASTEPWCRFNNRTPLSNVTRDFTFTYAGQTITYTVIDEDAKTCEIIGIVDSNGGNAKPGNKVSGLLMLPEHPSDGESEFTLTKLSRSAFERSYDMTAVIIPNTVTEIDRGAFFLCSGLTSVTIPNSVISLELDAFAYCSGLTEVTIGNSVTKIGNYAFHGCTGLTSVTIPNSVTSVGNYAFYECTGLTSVSIGNSVTEIGYNAFSGCTDLTAIEVKNLVPPTIYESSFSGLYDSVKLTIPQQGVNEYLNSNWIWFKDLNIRLENGNVQSASASDGTLDYYLIPAASANDKNLAIVKPCTFNKQVQN